MRVWSEVCVPFLALVFMVALALVIRLAGGWVEYFGDGVGQRGPTLGRLSGHAEPTWGRWCQLGPMRANVVANWCQLGSVGVGTLGQL